VQYIRELIKYYWPESLEDAVKMLMHEPCAEIIAGGTELLVSGKRVSAIKSLVDITRAELSYVKKDKKSIKIGSTTTISDIQHNPVFTDFANGILSEAARHFVSVQIRNVATIGGNLAAAMPSSDLVPVLMALDAKLHVTGKEKREFALNGFFISKRKTVMAPYEIIGEVEIPLPSPAQKTGYSFIKFGRTELDIAIVNGAAAIEIEADSTIKEARLALGSVASNTIRCLEIEKELAGKKLTKEIIFEICEGVSKAIDPKSDVRASAKYRGKLAKVIAGRLIEKAYKNAGGKI